MAKFKITAPVAGYSGNVGGVQFAEGEAVIDEETNPAELAYCRNAGYLIEEIQVDEPTQVEAGQEKPKRTPAGKRSPVKEKT